MSDKVYTYNDYILSYDYGGENDRSCMIISKILNGNLYVMSELYNGSADVISIMLDDLIQELQQKENIIKELNDKIEDDKMIIEGNFGCIDNLRKDYNLQKNIIKEVREYNEKVIKEGWYGGFEKDNAKHNLEILDKEVN